MGCIAKGQRQGEDWRSCLYGAWIAASGNDLIELLGAFQKKEARIQLDLRYVELTDNYFDALISALTESPSWFHSLCLLNNGLTDSHVIRLIDALSECRNLVHLELQSAGMRVSTALKLLDTVDQYPRLKCLEIFGLIPPGESEDCNPIYSKIAEMKAKRAVMGQGYNCKITCGMHKIEIDRLQSKPGSPEI
jgi:hypothetical protein